MNIILSIGILIFTGYILGEIVEKASLPKISGYIIAGIILNPYLFGIMSEQFVEHTDPLITVSLSLITFSIGGSLSYQKIKKTGKTMIFLTLFEAFGAFIMVFLVIATGMYFFLNIFAALNMIIAVSLILASLAAPTDPSATLAVIHEYKADGVVSSSMLEIAAFDDVIGIIIYTLVSAFSTVLLGQGTFQIMPILAELGSGIGGAVLVGGMVGLLFYVMAKIFKKQSEGSLIVITLGLVLLTYGISEYFHFESLLSTMILGVVVINSNPFSDKIFRLIERYTDELIFVIFFSLSGLHLQLSSIQGSFLIILFYILARMIGKFLGIFTGSSILNADPQVKKYAAGGLIPQGGIVIGLALLLTREPAFKESAAIVIGIVIGAALIHEIFGPVLSRVSLKRAGEI